MSFFFNSCTTQLKKLQTVKTVNIILAQYILLLVVQEILMLIQHAFFQASARAPAMSTFLTSQHLLLAKLLDVVMYLNGFLTGLLDQH